jgi:hypothetical protein
MKYVDSYGAVWRLSDRAYKRFLRDVAAGKTWDINDYGKLHCSVSQNITDIDREQATSLLKALEEDEREKAKRQGKCE